jgi:hypothetical protein
VQMTQREERSTNVHTASTSRTGSTIQSHPATDSFSSKAAMAASIPGATASSPNIAWSGNFCSIVSRIAFSHKGSMRAKNNIRKHLVSDKQWRNTR